ncbi:MAG: cupin domain-containing protein [Deinococcus sp.]|nr:cupin domain-containing protein [Deinococcus sp.]
MFVDRRKLKRKELVPGVQLGVMWGEKLMLSFVDIAEGAEVPLHSHPHEQAGIVLEGEMELTIGEQSRVLKPGDSYIIPGGVKHGVKPGKRCRALDVFNPPREEYK